MTPEDRAVCLLCRQQFSDSHRRHLETLARLHRIDWHAAYLTADHHGVAPLVHHNLLLAGADDLRVPRETLDQFKVAQIQNVLSKRRTARMVDQILALFAGMGVDVMLVKGAAMDLLVYREPWYVRSYDVDLVIRPKREELDAADHRAIVDSLEGFNHSQIPFKGHIEYDFYEHHDVTMNNVLAVDSARLWAEARPVRVGEQTAFALSIEDMLITAAINSCRKRYFRLKSLLDIATIVEGCPELSWPALTAKARAYEANTIVHTALLVTRTLLGCPLPEEVLDGLQVSRLRAALLARMVESLWRRRSLDQLDARSEGSLMGRQFSWPLALTYAAYRSDHLLPKLKEIAAAWRHPHPSVP